MEFFRNIHKTFYAHDFNWCKKTSEIYYLVRDNYGKEIRCYSLAIKTVKTIFRGTSSINSLVVSEDGRLLAYNENGKLNIYYTKSGENIIFDQDLYPSHFCCDSNYIIAVKYVGTMSHIIKFHVSGMEYFTIFKTEGYVGDPKRNFNYEGTKVLYNLMYDDTADHLFVLSNNYNLKSSVIYCYDYKKNWVFKKIQLDHGFVLNGKIIYHQGTVYFKMISNGIVSIFGYNVSDDNISYIVSFSEDVNNFTVNNDMIYIEVFSKQSLSTYIYSYDLKNKNIESEVMYDGCNTPVACSNGNLIYVHSDFQTPPELYSTENDNPVRLTYSSYQKYEFLFQNIDMMAYSSQSGVICKCYYNKNTNIDRKSIIVWLHGGPQICSLNSYVPFELWLCSLGYTIYVPSYRGTLGCGVDWALGAREENIGVADLNDIADLIETLLKSPTSYNCKIGIAGVSYGAYLALRCAAMINGISAVFGFGAICDWRIQQSLTEKRNYDYWLLGNWYFNRDVKNISPCFEISKIKIPVFLTHGKIDTDVPFKQIEEYKLLAEKNRKHNIMFRFYENEGHGLPRYKTANIENWHKLIIHFFNYYLKEWDGFTIPFSNQSYLEGREFEDNFDPLGT